jgi:hypothetical protein
VLDAEPGNLLEALTSFGNNNEIVPKGDVGAGSANRWSVFFENSAHANS